VAKKQREQLKQGVKAGADAQAPREQEPGAHSSHGAKSSVDPVDFASLTSDDLRDLVERGQAGDEAANEILSDFFAQGGNESWDMMGDVGLLAERALLASVLGSQPADCLAISERSRALRAELLSAEASALEKLAVDRVVLAYSFAGMVDMLITSGGLDALASERCVKAQVAGEKRLQEAMRTLEIARQQSRSKAAVPLKVVAAPPDRRAVG